MNPRNKLLQLYQGRYKFQPDGTVISLCKAKQGKLIYMKTTLDRDGYERYTLTDKFGKQHTVFKHKLVLILNNIFPKKRADRS